MQAQFRVGLRTVLLRRGMFPNAKQWADGGKETMKPRSINIFLLDGRLPNGLFALLTNHDVARSPSHRISHPHTSWEST